MAAVASPAADRPNLVFMIEDGCSYLDMELHGGQAKTPRLNRLAGEGMRFLRCFQAAPMCSPTRHNIYTGIYPVKSGAWPNHTNVYPGTKSIAHYLHDAGYRVALSGKTHIGPRESFPFAKWTCYELGLASAMVVPWPGKVEAGSPTSPFARRTPPRSGSSRCR